MSDGQVFPHATGAALATVERHQESQDLVFYAGWFCPYVQRTWIALEERGIPYQYKEVNPYKKEKHFLAINPKGLVPAIEYKGQALYESLILSEFLEDAYPEYTPRLLPSDPFQKAQVRLQIDYIGKNVIPAFMRTVQAQQIEKQQEGLKDLYAGLKQVSERVKGPFFLGEEFSLADVALAPWVVRDYIVAEHRGYKREEVGGGWKEYAEHIEKRESVLKTTSESQHYDVIYGRYLRDEAQSEAAKAIRAGRPIP
ncbi:hypothetical protein JAAARDRAFT_41703 [Jaapia argillacea MUCL 33604]|uniref:GST N-terminal domain-containing protein n=1 Tax=Jaapia argillacea MUCL 33604 TaxID=933084 RepID=A0A067PKF7_9AGAM|nr:hypothetical protein JAAARDRAFT_41703 [Jaapia argillacea MUCL 33604]